MSISAIDGDTIRQICVSQVITTVGGALKELIENALDAGATEITIRATNWGVEELTVEDNGRGIKEDDFERVVAAHATSKISDFGDLQKGVGTFGFRGEALSALCGLSNLSVDTRHASAAAGTQLTFSTAQAIAARTRSTRSKVGTTVAVRGLFCTLPVRRKELERNGKKEFQTALRTVQEYCVASVGVRIKLLHKAAAGKGYTVLVSSSGRSLIENVHEVFGMPVTKDLSKVNIKLHNGMIISGFASKPIRGCGRAKTDARFMYIRARPVDIPAFASKVNLAYRRMNQKEKPMFFLNISGNAEDFDVNVTPDKRTVMMKALDEIGEAVYEGFKTLWEGADPHAPQNGGGSGSAPGLPRSTSASAAMKQVAWNDEALDADADQILVAPSTPVATPGVGGGGGGGGVLSPVSPSTAKGLLSMLTQSADTLCLEQEQAEAEAEEAEMEAEAEAAGEEAKPEEARALDFEGPADDDSGSTAPVPHSGAAAASAAVAPAPDAAPQSRRPPPPPPADVDMERGGEQESTAEGRGAAAGGRAAKRRRLATGVSDGSASSSSDNEYEANSMMSEESEEPGSTPGGPTPSPPASALTAFEPVPLPTPTPAPAPAPTPTRGKAKAKDKTKVRTVLSHASVRRPDGGGGRGGVLEGADAWGMVSRRVAATPARQLASSGVEVRLLPAATAASDARAVRGTVRVDLAAVASRLAVPPEAEASGAPQGAWCAYAGKSARCEEELSSRVTKTDFEKMRVVGQFNKGFIIAGLGRELFLVDQHATDEKYNFERLKAAYQVRPQPLVQPRPLFIPAGDALLLRDHLHVFTQNGFRFKFSDDGGDGDANNNDAGGAEDEGGSAARIYVTAVPVSYNTTFTDHDIQEIIAILRELPGAKAVRPTRTTAMLASRACRSSVMIGTALDRREMRTILSHMGTMKNPWNCPHGRPTLRHLTSLAHPPLVGSAHQMRTQAGDFAVLATPSAACARPLPCQGASDAAADVCS